MTHIVIHDRNFIRRARRRLSMDERVSAAFFIVLDHLAALPRRYVTHALILAVAVTVAASLARS